VAGSLPAGLSLASGTGQISGTPTTAGTSNFTVQVTGADGAASTRALSISVVEAGGPVPGAPTITTEALPDGNEDAPYEAQLMATGGETPYAWSLVSGALPAGLSLDGATGRIAGTPTTMGAATFLIQVTGADGIGSTRSFGINVGGPLPVPEAPTGLIRDVVRVGDRNYFRLRWTDISNVETRYEVERKTSGDFMLVAILPANSTQFLEPVIAGHPRYRVRACNATGCSEWLTD
jgi:hypothetical protein